VGSRFAQVLVQYMFTPIRFEWHANYSVGLTPGYQAAS
jgi:hypothetical protein